MQYLQPYESGAGLDIGCVSKKEARGNSEAMIILDVEFLCLIFPSEV